ncbi:hypothetical protein [Parvimonas sp. G1641]
MSKQPNFELTHSNGSKKDDHTRVLIYSDVVIFVISNTKNVFEEIFIFVSAEQK